MITFLKENCVKWPCRTNINYETGKIEIICNKINTSIWPHFGKVEQDYTEVPISVCETKVKCHIVDRIKLTHNSYLILIKHNVLQQGSTSQTDAAGQMEIIPIGKHVRLYITVKGKKTVIILLVELVEKILELIGPLLTQSSKKSASTCGGANVAVGDRAIARPTDWEMKTAREF